MRSGAAVSIFPEGKAQLSRKRAAPDEPKKVQIVGFRPRVPDQLAWYKELKAKKYSNSDILTKLTDLLMDMEKELGDSWRKIEALATLEGTSPGTIIGKMMKRHLDEIETRLAKK